MTLKPLCSESIAMLLLFLATSLNRSVFAAGLKLQALNSSSGLYPGPMMAQCPAGPILLSPKVPSECQGEEGGKRLQMTPRNPRMGRDVGWLPSQGLADMSDLWKGVGPANTGQSSALHYSGYLNFGGWLYFSWRHTQTSWLLASTRRANIPEISTYSRAVNFIHPTAIEPLECKLGNTSTFTLAAQSSLELTAFWHTEHLQNAWKNNSSPSLIETKILQRKFCRLMTTKKVYRSLARLVCKSKAHKNLSPINYPNPCYFPIFTRRGWTSFSKQPHQEDKCTLLHT